MTESQDTILDVVENLVADVVEKHFDAAFEAGLEAVKKAIPGEQFDGIATIILQHMQSTLKKEVLKLVDKIDKKVG